MANKMMKQLKNLSATELTSKVRELEASLFRTRMQRVTGQLANIAQIWSMRKELARVKTLQSAAKGK